VLVPSSPCCGPARADNLTPKPAACHDIYKELVEIDTTTATGERRGVGALAARLKAAASRRRMCCAVARAAQGNLVARLRGTGSASRSCCGASRRGAALRRTGRSIRQADRAKTLLLGPRLQRRQIHGDGFVTN